MSFRLRILYHFILTQTTDLPFAGGAMKNIIIWRIPVLTPYLTFQGFQVLVTVSAKRE